MNACRAAVLVATTVSLSGCWGDSEPEPREAVQHPPTVAAERTTETPTPSPTTETSEVVLPQVAEAEETVFVAYIKENAETAGLPDDVTLIIVGYVMCEGYRTGISNAQLFATLANTFDLSLDQMLEMDTAAREYLCPDVE